jgi:CxxC-x17-CxxC domain-containing protein
MRVLVKRRNAKGITRMEFEDKMLTCRDCNKQFVFSAGEQEFFSAKGLVNEPKRCPNCRLLMRIQRNGEDVNRVAEVSCAECGVPTRVPFQPKGYRPVYCAYCFQTKKRETQSDQPASTEEQTELDDIVSVTNT